MVFGLVSLTHVAAAQYSAVSGSFGNSLTAIDLRIFDPTPVGASRTGSGPCVVTWTTIAGVPGGVRYDVLDSSNGATLASSVSGSTTNVVTTGTLKPLVRARVSAMYSPVGTTSETTCPGIPDAPTGVTAAAAYKSTNVSWTAPSANLAAITTYTAKALPGGATCSATPPSTSCAISGLTAGTAYTVTVTATNSVGTGPASSPAAGVTPYAEPYAATGLSATPQQTQAALSWTAPPSSGSAVTSYTATLTNAIATTRTCTSATTSCTVTGLIDGLTYDVSVTATNAIGTGAATTTTVLPYPSQIMTSTVMRLWVDGADQATLFTDPACSSPVTASGQGVGCWRDKSGQGNHLTQTDSVKEPVTTSASGHLVPQFDGNDDVLDDFTTTLPVGASSATAFFAGAYTGSSPSMDGQAKLFWSGSQVTGEARFVTKTANSNDMVTNANGTSAAGSGNLVTGATFVLASDWVSGTSYGQRFSGTSRVSASASYTITNSQTGIGAWSNSWQGRVPEAIVLSTNPTASQTRVMEEYLARKWSATITPAAPGIGTATRSSSFSASVTWSSPAWDGGAGVTSYTVTSSPGSHTCSTSGTSCTVGSLSTGTAYTFTVTATNSMGAGPVSSASNSVTP